MLKDNFTEFRTKHRYRKDSIIAFYGFCSILYELSIGRVAIMIANQKYSLVDYKVGEIFNKM